MLGRRRFVAVARLAALALARSHPGSSRSSHGSTANLPARSTPAGRVCSPPAASARTLAARNTPSLAPPTSTHRARSGVLRLLAGASTARAPAPAGLLPPDVRYRNPRSRSLRSSALNQTGGMAFICITSYSLETGVSGDADRSESGKSDRECSARPSVGPRRENVAPLRCSSRPLASLGP